MEAAARYYFARDYAEAERCCHAVLAREPGHFDARHLLGVIYLDRGQSAEAIEHLKKAAALQPEHAVRAMGRCLSATAAARFANPVCGRIPC